MKAEILLNITVNVDIHNIIYAIAILLLILI